MPESLGNINLTWPLYATFTIAYLFGSIPFGLLVTKLSGLKDIRNIGSGNIGATNVLRTGNTYLALITLILDCSKGFFMALTAGYFFSKDYQILAGVAAILGHMLPIWLIINNKIKFSNAITQLIIMFSSLIIMLNGKSLIQLLGALILSLSTFSGWGGKGVATSIGVLLCINPFTGVLICITWCIILALFKYSSLSALISFITAPIAIYVSLNLIESNPLNANEQIMELSIFISIIIWIRHIENIYRLFMGKETKVIFKKSKKYNII